MSILTTLKDAVFEPEPGEAVRPPNVNHAALQAVADGGAARPPSPPPSTALAAATGEAYDALLARTSFQATEAGCALNRYLAALDGVPLDPAVKLSAALAQARKLDGVTADAVRAGFEEVRVALDLERKRFEEASARFRTGEVEARQRRIQALTGEIDERQRLLAQLATELTQAQANVARAASQFTAAADRRGREIDEERSRFAALLQE
jgi:hypothetical protein